MPSGTVRQLNGELTKSKSKGKAFVAELGRVMSQDNIARTKPETQPIKNTKK